MIFVLFKKYIYIYPHTHVILYLPFLTSFLSLFRELINKSKRPPLSYPWINASLILVITRRCSIGAICKQVIYILNTEEAFCFVLYSVCTHPLAYNEKVTFLKKRYLYIRRGRFQKRRNEISSQCHCFKPLGVNLILSSDTIATHYGVVWVYGISKALNFGRKNDL